MKKNFPNNISSIGERRFLKASKGLASSYTELVAMIENVPLAILLMDKNRVIRKANSAAAKFSGIMTDTMMGLVSGEALHCINSSVDPRGCGFSPSCKNCTMRRVISDTFIDKKGFREIEAKLSINDKGETKDLVLMVYTSLVHISNEQLGLVCIEDITERRKTENKLERLASFPRLNPNPIVEFDSSGEVTFSNEAAEKIISKIGKKHKLSEFLPKNIGTILKSLKKKEKKHFRREVEIDGYFFSETIHIEPEFDVVRIYAWDITSRKVAEREVQYLSMHDKLTGLYNRNFFEKRLASFKRRKFFKGGVIMIDINGLKKINDTFGHSVGDQAIKKVARLISAEFRKNDVVARIGGDEFCVLLPGMDSKEIKMISLRIQEKVSAARKRKNDTAELGVAIGTAYVEKGKELSKALNVADKMMYRNKFAMKKAT